MRHLCGAAGNSLTEPMQPGVRGPCYHRSMRHLAYVPAGHRGGARRARGPAGGGRPPGSLPWQLPQHRRRPGPDPGRGGGRRERLPPGRNPGGRLGGGLVRLLPHPAVRTVRHHPAGRHRDHHPAAGHRGRGHRDRGLGAPPARGREPAGRLSRRDQRRRPGRRDRQLAARADRPGSRPAHPGAVAAGVPVPVRCRRARPARPACAHDGTVIVADQPWDVDARGFPLGHRHRTPGGGRRRVPGPVPDDARSRCPAHGRAAAAGGRARRPGRCRPGHQPPG